jgi:dCMP deaminase
MHQASSALTNVLVADEYIDTWDEYWLTMATTAARKSKDPKCRVGAVIVKDNLVLSSGFNGFARQVFDDPSQLFDTDEKLKRICHAEMNAIVNAARLGVRLEGATIYVTKFPCLACCNAIIQAGIRVISTQDTKFWDDDPADRDHSRKKSTLRQAGIKVEAPFLDYYAPKPLKGRRASVAVSPAANDATSVVIPPKKRTRKPTKSGKTGSANLNLFPARRAIRGGKSDDD